MPPKRKRPDRGPNDGGSGRPSPHRPGDTTLGQHDRGYGGRGSRSTRRSERRDSSQTFGGAASSAPAPSPNLPRPSSASSQTAAPPNPVITAPPPASSTSPIQSGYDYAIITDDRIGRWATGGRKEVVDHGVQSRTDEDSVELSTIFQELIHAVIDRRLAGVNAGAVVKDIVGPKPAENEGHSFAFDPRTLFLDTISIDFESGDYQPQLRELMVATEISPMLMRQVLDPPLLEKMGLIRSTFSRVGIRLSTNLLYRQANYNLLREESEGYSKLTTELFTTSSTEPPSSETVLATFERVKGLIGSFDLDVGRVLDVTLDVFAAVLIKQFRFFIKFLRISSWWPRSQIQHSARTYVGGLPLWALPESYSWLPNDEDETVLSEQRLQRDIAFWDRARQVHLDAFFELGGRQVADADEIRRANAATDDHDVDAEQQWIQTTKTLPPPGNRVAAQLLGFKLRFYASEARDAEDVLPANLLYLAALLVKVGFISLSDLWPHLWPLDEDMDNVRAAKMKELEEKERANRPGGSNNALMIAGALPDDMPAMSSLPNRRDPAASKTEAETKAAKETETKPRLPEPEDQKVHLLKCLLTIGALPESLFILGRYDWLPEAYPELLPLIHRILHHSVDTVYHQSQPTSSAPVECPPKQMPDIDQTGVPKGTVKLGVPPPKRPLRWPYPDKADTNEGNTYRFYWDEWADNVPICQTVDDVFTLCSTLLNLSGVNIGKDAALLMKLASIGSRSLAMDQSPQNLARWQDLLRRLLVPALSLTDSNSSAVSAIWDLLKQYPIPVRYTIYAEWYEGQISRLGPMKMAFARTRLDTLRTMKRLSLTNIPQMARTLAKAAFASPGVVFKVALDQIESYSNLIEVFVECAKYFTELGYDVLVWSLMSSLGGKQRSRTQETSVLLTSKWLQALSRFSGKVFTRYSNMDPTPVIQYVHDQLYNGNSTDLVILKELVSSMGGVVSDTDFTDAQLRAMTGGEILRRETLKNLGDKREASAKSAARLMRALVSTKLAGQLLINVAQYRQSAIYQVPDTEAHIKLLATMVDDTHQVLVQYLDLLRSNLKPDEFDGLVPDVVLLMKDYGLDAGLAFMIGRASLIARMMNPKSPIKDDHVQSQILQPRSDGDGDVAMETAVSTSEPTAASGPGQDATEDNVAADTGGKDTSTEQRAPAQLANGRKSDPFLEALQPVIEAMPTLIPAADIWQRISPEFYVVFWSLQLGDLALPQSSYEAEHAKLRKQAEDVMKDRTDMSRSGMNKKDQKKRDLLDKAESIHEENKHHLERYHKTKVRLARESATWFPGSMAKANATSDTILEQCILPRLHLSSVDSEYCFRMVKFLHENQAPNFRLMALYDRFFNQNRLRSMIFTCTVREAEHLARFIKCILSDLSRWHGDKEAYEKEALGKKTRSYLGFATAFDEGGKPTAFVEHDSFRDLLFRWHKNLNTALRSCLGGMEWMHIRNAITVLKTVIDFFPAITFMADKFLEQLKSITERETATKNVSDAEEGHQRVDLAVTAQTAFSELQKRKSKWILVQAFRPGTTGESKDEPKPSAPATTANLRPTAAEFQPTRSSRNQTTGEVEDGEVKDSKDGKSRLPRATPANEKQRESTTSRPSLPPKESSRDNAGSAVPKSSSGPGTGTTSKPSTPKPAAAVPATATSSRAVLNKPPTIGAGGHSLPNRPDLPSRPDVPFPRNFPTDRFGNQLRPPGSREPLPARESLPPTEPHTRELRETREPREPHPRDVRDSRDYRTPEAPRPERLDRGERQDRPERSERQDRLDRPERPERPQEFPRSSDRRPVEGPARDPGRPSERDWPSRPEPPPRWNEHGVQDRDNRLPRESRGGGANRNHDGRQPRESHVATPPPAGTASRPDTQQPPTDPARPRLPEEDRPEIMNPARAALINDSRDTPPMPPMPPRPMRDTGRDRPPRTESPRLQSDQGRDERQGRHRQSDYYNSSRDAQKETTPSHSNGERDAERERDRSSDRARDGTAFQGPPPRPADSDHGRLSHQDPNYGRLNPIQSVPDIPSGPRGRGRNSTRGNTMNGPPPLPLPPHRGDGRFPSDPNRPPSPDRPPPTGPSSSRSRRGQFDTNSNSPTTAVPPPPPSFPPDRLRNNNPPEAHHDRSARVAGPAQSAGPPPQSRAGLPPLNTPDRPSPPTAQPGSRPMQSSLPNTPAADVSTPTGPSASNDRMRPGGNRQLRGIQSTLNQAQADNIRKVGSRTNIAGTEVQILTGSSPVSTPVHDRHDPSTRETNSDRPPRYTEPIQAAPDSREGRGPNGEDYNSGRGDHDRGSRRDVRERSDRSGRPSRRSSPERSSDRDRDSKEPREFRDRRRAPPGPGAFTSSNPRDMEREQGSSRRSMREPSGSNRDSFPGPNRVPVGVNRESSHRSHRGDGPGGRGEASSGRGEDYNGAGRGGGRGGGFRDSRSRPGDDRLEPVRDDRGRKRRSEDASGLMMGNEREKRQRR